MSLTDLLFSFKGRINRKPWWLATIAAGLVASVVTAIIEIAARSSGHVAIDPVTNRVEPTGFFGVLVGAVGLVNNSSPSPSARRGCTTGTAPAGG